MSLQRQSVSINFAQGLDSKTDPAQLSIGKFTSLQNAVFDKLGQLTKRNGFSQISVLPDGSSRFITTYNGNLTALGKTLYAYSSPTASWINKGPLHPLSLSTLPVVRNNTNQSQVDTALSSTGLLCAVYTDNVTSGSTSTQVAKYTILDSATGQSIVNPTTITTNFGSVVYGSKVFTLGNNFILVFTANSATSYHLQYMPINIYSPSVIGSIVDVSTTFEPSSSGAFDGYVANNRLYLSWNSASNSGIKSSYLTQNLSLSSAVGISSTSATLMSVTADTTQSTPVIYSSFYVAGSNSGYVVATDQNLSTVFPTKQIVSSASLQVANITSVAIDGRVNVFMEERNTYTYNTVSSNLIVKTFVTQTGSVDSLASVVRSVGLASKAFLVGSSTYFLSAYSSPYQASYFLMNSTGGIISKLAYSNGGGYVTQGLPSFSSLGSTSSVGYLVKDLVQAANTDTNVASGTQVDGIYSQTGVNLAKFTLSSNFISTAETANNLHVNGGFVWAYDGQVPVEQGFFVYPDSIAVTTSSAGGSLVSQAYYYRATYEWSDNAGNVFRSAPSIPVKVTTTGADQSTNTISVPTLRLTYKTITNPKVVIYRWSAAQQNYYQITSISSPTMSNPLIDSVSYTDKAADASILGNNLLYTTGGVVENISAPPSSALTLFDNRMWAVDSENPNQLWFSKSIVQSSPVDMSDLLTLYVPPTTATNISTGPIKCLASMDDKLIIFKKNAIYYVTGMGPDDTGANNQYSQAIFVTATVGCSTQNSITFTPNGLLFKSDKGIWLLGRDLSTAYVGAPVEEFNSSSVLSALTVPGTNQVRFTLDNGQVLLYDYFVNQWGSFTGVSNVSSTIYNDVHTFINSYGQAFAESVGTYLDGSRPVLMSFTTGFLNLAGLQGYQRTYRCYMLGQYKTPHKLTCGIAYDYDSSIVQQETISPTNYNSPWGISSPWGASDVWGGVSAREQWQINFQRQQCQSFQLTFNEYFDATVASVSAGAGLTISGLNIVAGVKKSYPRNLAAKAKV